MPVVRPLLGLIPAGAGNIWPSGVGASRGRAHPRRCGEHRSTVPPGPTWWGSSPQVRGTYIEPAGAAVVEGLIPAGAGNISHDRYVDADVDGSSPQVRGTSQARIRGVLGRGLIPAGAGNIYSGGHGLHPIGAHPRRCGEHAPSGHTEQSVRGSSPQVRGTSTTPPTSRVPERLIPAGAGNMGDHFCWRRRLAGSSPQVRGTSRLLAA